MTWLFWLLLIVPGVLAAYVLFVRPVLKALPELKAFYAEADGFWAKVWVICRSVTNVWAALLTGLGGLWQYLDPVATALGEPDLKQQILDLLKDHPSIVGYVLMVISGITLAARLRSIGKGVVRCGCSRSAS